MIDINKIEEMISNEAKSRVVVTILSKIKCEIQPDQAIEIDKVISLIRPRMVQTPLYTFIEEKIEEKVKELND